MHLLHNECDHPGKSSIQFLPMIDMNPGENTRIFSTLDYICKLAARHNMPAIVTFDQPLFWKAHEVVNSVADDSPIRNFVLLLELFTQSWTYLEQSKSDGRHQAQGHPGNCLWGKCYSHDERKGSTTGIPGTSTDWSRTYRPDSFSDHDRWP